MPSHHDAPARPSAFLDLLHTRRAMLKAAAGLPIAASATSALRRSARAQTPTPTPGGDAPETEPTPNATQTSLAQLRDQELASSFDPSVLTILVVNNALYTQPYGTWDWNGRPHFFFSIDDAVASGVYTADRAPLYQTPTGIDLAAIIEPAGDPGSGQWNDVFQVAATSYDDVATAEAVMQGIEESGGPLAGAPDVTSGTAGDYTWYVRPYEFSNGAQGAELRICTWSRNWHFELQSVSPDPAMAGNSAFIEAGLQKADALVSSGRACATPSRIDQNFLQTFSDDDINPIISTMRPLCFEGQRSFDAQFGKFNGQTCSPFGTDEERLLLEEAYFLSSLCVSGSSEIIPGSDSIGYSQTVRNFASRDEARSFFDAQPTDAQTALHEREGVTQVEDDAARTDDARMFYGTVGTDSASTAATYTISHLYGTTVTHLGLFDLAQPVPGGTLDPTQPQFERLKSGANEVFDQYRDTRVNGNPWIPLAIPIILK
jgi:hypothetical protein